LVDHDAWNNFLKTLLELLEETPPFFLIPLLPTWRIKTRRTFLHTLFFKLLLYLNG